MKAAFSICSTIKILNLESFHLKESNSGTHRISNSISQASHATLGERNIAGEANGSEHFLCGFVPQHRKQQLLNASTLLSIRVAERSNAVPRFVHWSAEKLPALIHRAIGFFASMNQYYANRTGNKANNLVHARAYETQGWALKTTSLFSGCGFKSTQIIKDGLSRVPVLHKSGGQTSSWTTLKCKKQVSSEMYSSKSNTSRGMARIHLCAVEVCPDWVKIQWALVNALGRGLRHVGRFKKSASQNIEKVSSINKFQVISTLLGGCCSVAILCCCTLLTLFYCDVARPQCHNAKEARELNCMQWPSCGRQVWSAP